MSSAALIEKRTRNTMTSSSSSSSRLVLLSLLLVVASIRCAAEAFCTVATPSAPGSGRIRRPPSFAAAVAADAAPPAAGIVFKRLENEDEIMDVASFRNDFTSPEMLVARQQAKSDAVDTTAAALDGVKIGLGIGSAAAILTYLRSDGDVAEAAEIFGVVGGLMSTLLGLNAKMGRTVHVPTLDEAKNRLKVDFVEGLMARQDVGFVATTDDLQGFGGKYEGCNGVVAAIDCQLRNCDSSSNPRKYGSLPPHVHIKNLYVDQPFRRRGVAKELVKRVEDYASKTEAEMITLAVEDNNIAAVNLYGDMGYDSESIGSPLAQGKWGQYMAGRSMMTKQL